jgi:hypothetical protein
MLLYHDVACPLSARGLRFRGSHWLAGPRQRGAQKEGAGDDRRCVLCGSLFSFEGGEGACPRCGKVASVTAGPVTGSPGRREPETPVPVMSRVGQNGKRREHPRRATAGSPAGIAIATVARRDRTTRKRRRQP